MTRITVYRYIGGFPARACLLRILELDPYPHLQPFLVQVIEQVNHHNELFNTWQRDSKSDEPKVISIAQQTVH